MKFSLPISTPNQVFRKQMSVRRFCLSLAAGIMRAACVAGCKTATPQAQAQADTTQTAAGVRHNQLSIAAMAGQPSPSLDPKMPPAAQAALQEAQGLTLLPGFCTFFPQFCQQQLLPGESEVTSFGSNPGNIQMFKYVPQDLGTSPPLVVALHGCGQSATSYDDETGWVQLANKFHFVLLLPQQDQNGINNPFKCFRWFDSTQNQRDKGEAFSIKHMIDTMLADTSLNIDRKRVYVTGLSAGGGMTAVMLATYPEIFAGGAPIAGVPYGCTETPNDATTVCGVSLSLPGIPSNTTMKQLTPAEWGDRVRNASPRSAGPFPRVSIWQGTKDQVVDPQAEIELIKQWTNVLGVSQTPQVDVQFKTTRHQVFQDSAGKPMVEAFIVKDMAHGTPIDPGSAPDQCGTSAHDQFIIPAGICSSFFIAKFWGLAP
jgi:poly(hydroxyalkanoate) depolymerase family esterase